MSRPLIAVCPQYDLTAGFYRMAPAYMEAIQEAGGFPVVLPFCSEDADPGLLSHFLLSRFDGLLVPGGPDVSPFVFGEEARSACGPICGERDETELSLIPAFIRAGKPVFGICRGIQSMNIALGGDIWQDIPSMTDSRLQHSQASPGTEPVHTVSVTEGSLLHKITGRKILRVNSFHHQAVRRPAEGFSVCGISPDGLTEAQYMPDRPFVLGVQWHPELLFRKDEAAFSLFAAFVAACRQAAP